MNKKIRWITETAVLLALLVTLQALTKPMGQLVTGSCVNAILAVAVLVAGLGSGVTIAIALDAPQNTISSLAGKVGCLPGISVKTAYSGVVNRE